MYEFTFIIHLLFNPTHCCTLTKPTCNYIAMLVYKPKQHLKQHTGIKYVIYIEMSD